MYKCIECGHVFEEGEQATYRENQGECFGYLAYEEFSCCPICKGNYEEAVQCEKCGEYYLEDELLSGICESCLDSFIDYENSLEFLKSNGLLKDFFLFYVKSEIIKGNNAIEELNKEFVIWFNRQRVNDRLNNSADFLSVVKEYIKSNRYEWSDYLSEEVKD